jgi:hypothetical protein
LTLPGVFHIFPVMTVETNFTLANEQEHLKLEKKSSSLFLSGIRFEPIAHHELQPAPLHAPLVSD